MDCELLLEIADITDDALVLTVLGVEGVLEPFEIGFFDLHALEELKFDALSALKSGLLYGNLLEASLDLGDAVADILLKFHKTLFDLELASG